jgi:N-methylhydantoinase A
MRLDADAARMACQELGQKLGSDAEKTAWGIWEIAKVGMARALRAQFAQKGLDPRDFAIISRGGCGGLFNSLIAQELGIKRVLVPELTSVLSAFGAANADVRRERVRGVGMALPCAAEELSNVASTLRRSVMNDLEADGIAESARSVSFEADLRYMRQQFELTIPANGGFHLEAQQLLSAAFQTEYAQRYGQGAVVLGAPVELVSLRAVGIGQTVHADLAQTSTAVGIRAATIGKRQVWVGNGAGVEKQQVEVIAADLLQPGHRIEGPALLDGSDTTIWIPTGVRAVVDPHRTIDMEMLS